MSSLNSFARRIRQRGRQVETGANAVKRRVALIADRELVMETPVDTGRARSNWVVSLQAPVLAPREPYAPGSRLGKGERSNAEAAIAQGLVVISAARSEHSIFISNNVHYIGRLNEGWSAQAPAGFVEAAVMRAVNSVKGARILSGN